MLFIFNQSINTDLYSAIRRRLIVKHDFLLTMIELLFFRYVLRLRSNIG